MNNCPYSFGCKRIHKRFSEGAPSELEKGVLSALSAHYAPCNKKDPNKRFLEKIEACGYDVESLLCFSGHKVAEMENALELAEVW